MHADNDTPPARRPAHDPELARRALDLKLSAGLSHDQIGRELGISVATVSRLLSNAERLLTRPPREVVMRELLDLAWMEDELRREWLRSCQNKQSVTIKDGEDGVTETQKTEFKHGDAAIMRALLQVKHRRAALLGLDAPKKVNVTQEHSQTVVAVVLPVLLEWCQSVGVPPDRIEELAERLEQATTELPEVSR